jgi:hypothetical protein
MTMTNISPAAVTLLRYGQARAELAGHPLSVAEIPVGHEISLPVPTLRFGEPGYAWFAAPARRRPGQPLVLGAPDRWWALGAARRGLLAYGRTSAVPFSPEPLAPARAELPPIARDLEAIGEDLRLLESLGDRAVPAFFAGEPGDPALRGDLLGVLTAHVTPPLTGWYRALAPDFFSWLDNS